MKNRPFALVGVNSDKTKEKVRDAMARENITWRSFWNGGGTRGPISQQYGVSSWPTIYVLDHNGVIRAKNVRGEKMDEVVDELVAAAEAEGLTAVPDPTAPTAPAPDDTVSAVDSDKSVPQPAKDSPEPTPATEGFEVGDLAPDIIGADLNDLDFKLSDYRGRVVVLDFWGDW